MPDGLRHNPDITREIECKDCKTKAVWNDAVKAGWVLGGCSGGYRCKACSNQFEKELADVMAMRTPAMQAWITQNFNLLHQPPCRIWPPTRY